MKRSKTYKKVHKKLVAAKGHVKNIQKRGGGATITGTTVQYDFPVKPKKKGKRRKKK